MHARMVAKAIAGVAGFLIFIIFTIFLFIFLRAYLTTNNV